MENLVSILLSNGTGLLEGLCRPVGKYYLGFEETPHYSGPNEELIEVAFSLNEKNLGTFNLYIVDCARNQEPPIYTGGFDCALNTEELTSQGKKVWIEITWGIHSDFARFAATLENIQNY
jgi:hypothetical protein